MSEPSITIRPETADDAAAIERLHERTFGPGSPRRPIGFAKAPAIAWSFRSPRASARS
jgi:predicted N-acetyltransferase YhbS